MPPLRACPVDYQRLIDAAILAPSPDNNQPWQFEVLADKILLHADERHALPSDKDNLFCWMAIGAAAENLRIAAREQGYETVIEIVADGTHQEAPPSVAFTFPTQGSPDPLYPYLASRSTSRKLFARRPLEQSVLTQLTHATAKFPAVQVDWVTARPDVRSLAWIIGATDRVRFEYEPFHQELFKQLRLTVAEAEATRDGLDLRTLELPPGAPLLLRRLRSWRVMQWLHRSGVGRTLGLPSVAAVMASSAIGAVSVRSRSPDDYLAAGQGFQRLWLIAASLGLSIQPMGSLPIFMAHVEDAAHCPLTPALQQRLQKIEQRFHQVIPAVADRPLTMLFRIGFAAPVAVRSLRRTATSFIR